MAGIIERNARDQATIRQRVGITDGKDVWGDVSCRCFVFDSELSAGNSFGTIHSGKVFMIAPLAKAPILPCRIVFAEREYAFDRIKIYRNLKGLVLGYRLTSSGA